MRDLQAWYCKLGQIPWLRMSGAPAATFHCYFVKWIDCLATFWIVVILPTGSDYSRLSREKLFYVSGCTAVNAETQISPES